MKVLRISNAASHEHQRNHGGGLLENFVMTTTIVSRWIK
jgi:hypothetical protein